MHAINEEDSGLDRMEIFEHAVSRSELRKRNLGHIQPTPMKYMLETKLNPDGTFKKAKARKVLQGIQGRFMIKGIHFSVVSLSLLLCNRACYDLLRLLRLERLESSLA